MKEFRDMDFMNSAFTTGAFVTADGNPMVCSWGFVGVMWHKPVFIAPIRDSRFTKQCVDKKGVFTVSVPKVGTFKSELAFCGTKSGRDFDKWAETGMVKKSAKSIDEVVVDGCERYFECKVIGVVYMGDDMDISAVENWYPKSQKYPYGDRHYLYFGEIIEEY